MVKTESPLKITFNIDRETLGNIIAFDDKNQIGSIDFNINKEKKCIQLTDVFIEKPYRQTGYGKLIIGFLCSYAKIIGMPIKVFSIRKSVGFYKKIGFKEDLDEVNDKYIKDICLDLVYNIN